MPPVEMTGGIFVLIFRRPVMKKKAVAVLRVIGQNVLIETAFSP